MVQTQYIPPKGEFDDFQDVEHYKGKLKEWGLSSAKEAKKEFWYKDKNFQQLVSIKGYETYGKAAEFNTIVIEFPDGNLSCIHPAYLKEMQQSSFGKESVLGTEEKEDGTSSEKPLEDANAVEELKAEIKVEARVETPVEPAPQPKKAKETKSKKEKLDLPVDKVHFTASVKQFAMTYNAFTEENDEVVILENVRIEQDSPLEIGFAWCSHSKTLKKFELAPGDSLEFDGKVAAKKLPKGKDVSEEFIVDVPVLYKINNPSKIEKNTK